MKQQTKRMAPRLLWTLLALAISFFPGLTFASNGSETLLKQHAPQNLRLTGRPIGQVSLAWDTVDHASGYAVYRSLREAIGIDGFSLLGTTTETTYTDSFAVYPTTPYFYHIYSLDAEGRLLDYASIYIPATSGHAPQNLRLTGRPIGQVSLAWDTVDHASGYAVYRSLREAIGIDGFSLLGTTTKTTYKDSFAVYPTTPYFYHIYSLDGEGGLLDYASIYIPAKVTTRKYMEVLQRNLVAVATENGVFLSWTLFGDDPAEISFDLYRDGTPLNPEPITGATNFLDVGGLVDSVYSLTVLENGAMIESLEGVTVWAENYLEIPIQKPAGGITPDGVAYTYSANDASVGDLDGDGVLEIVLKWNPSNAKDNAHSGHTGNVYLDAYKMDGTLLWRIDLGVNIRAGAHYTQFMVYDFDCDGQAEVICKTADGTKDAAGTVIGDASADFRNSSGYILKGPEYLTVFAGATGTIMDTTDYIPQRGNLSTWGDTNGNRVDRFNAGVAYLDGKLPSFIALRGYYFGRTSGGRTAVAAFDLVDKKLVNRWTFDTLVDGSEHIGQGNHGLTVGDVDEDGKDEIVHGSIAFDDDGTVLWNNRLGHGDAMHMSDLDPSRPGLEIFGVKEDTNVAYHSVLNDAATGEVIWGYHNGKDTGRGLAANIDPRFMGAECWGTENLSVWSIDGEAIGTVRPSINFAIYWDGDASRELFDGISVRKWDYVNQQEVVLMVAEGCASNNGTKANPCLQADLVGDWREEILLRTSDDTALRLYTTTDLTTLRIPTLMNDPMYRVAIAWQNSSYNQPPHPSFAIGEGMLELGAPAILRERKPEIPAPDSPDGI